jgi:uncharacterized membrane protein YdbT with pleckstrin-like domain
MPDPTPTTRPGAAEPDRAAAAGLPPDSGPEQQVLVLRPSLARCHPIPTVLLALAPIAGGVVLPIVGIVVLPVALIAAGVIAVVCWGILAIWWVNFALARSLEITNKRTILHVGLLSRSTTEVLHDHIRNIQIQQSFAQRILGVGSIGISSAADAAVEIKMTGIPGPYRVRKVIDLYRPLG